MILTLLLPFLGGIVSFFSGQKKAPVVAIISMLAGGFFAVLMLLETSPLSYRWVWIPGHELAWHMDKMAAILISLVYLISLSVHIFSIHYLHAEAGLHRYFFKLGFFTSSMLGLLAADHLLLVFVFWELVGFSSFLLIGFWYKDIDKAKSAKDAFMVNRVADAGLLIGVILLVIVLDLPYLSEIRHAGDSLIVHLAGFGILIGALGKSAQFPFFGWLTRAMAGPTPVSALIHAATMVAAGVYLLVRMVPFLSPLVLDTTAVIGAVTAFMAAYAALTQFDMKKVLAYSTISQLGYMVMGVGVGAYQASLFHLWTHAFFKAGLFLAAGSVIHYMHHQSFPGTADRPEREQDMRYMGGLRKALPVTYVAFLICALALSGLPFFSGFLSKEGLLAGAWTWADAGGGVFAYLIPDLAFITALLTPIYIGRQVLLVFWGNSRIALQQVREAEPWAAKLPLVVLAVASLWFFSALNPLNARGWWLNVYLFSADAIGGAAAHTAIETWTLYISIILTLTGIAIAYSRYRPGSNRTINYLNAQASSSWYSRLSLNGWYINDFYAFMAAGYGRITKFASKADRQVIDPMVNSLGVYSVVFSKLLAIFDREVVDGLVNLAAWISRQVGSFLSRVQSPRVQSQIAWMLVALVVIILWFQF